MSQKPRFFTGIQASGTLTLGNYCGLIHHILKIQEKYEVIIMIADLHALTVPKKEFNYRQKCYEMAALLYACGLNENCKIFIQSEVKEHLELFYLLSPYITVGRLGDMIQFKEKEGTGNLALLSYPVLMAADIFLYDADLVIVGQDQKQHLELAADIAQKFNNFYEDKKLLKVPVFDIPNFGAKIMGLKKPENKMSKSGNDYVGLLDAPELVEKKISQAETDSENKIYYDPSKKPGISNLLTIYALLNGKGIKEVEEELKSTNYHQFKIKLSHLLNEKLAVIQKKYNDYLSHIKRMVEKNNTYLKDLAERKIKIIKKELRILY